MGDGWGDPMADVRIERSQGAGREVGAVAPDARERPPGRDRPSEEQRRREPGSAELAAALDQEGRATMEARLELGEDGTALVRIVDTARDETVAVVTPEELRDLAQRTGLPAGLLPQRAS